MTLREYLDVVRHRRIVVVAGVVLGLLVAGLVSISSPREYVAGTTIFVTAQSGSADASAALQANDFTIQRMTTYVELLKSDRLAGEVAAALGPDAPQGLGDRINASTVPETVLLNATVTDESPQRAARIADLVATQFIANVAELERPSDPAAAPLVVARVYQRATPPTEAVSPRPLFNLGLGLLLGLVVGIGGALLRNMLDTSVKSREQLRQLVGVPVLGAVEADLDVVKRPLVVRDDPQGRLAEAFRLLRTKLQFLDVNRDQTVILVTSGGPGEGKTTTVCNLAVAMADADNRVLVIEADLRRPKAADIFGIERTVGLSNVLAGRMHWEQAVRRFRPGLDVLPSGPVPPNPSELLGSATMIRLLDEVRGAYDIVLIDSSPLSPVTDAAALAPRVDGVLLVVRYAKVTADQARAARDALNAVSARLLGTVMTMVPGRRIRSYVGHDAYLAIDAESKPAGNRPGGSPQSPSPPAPPPPVPSSLAANLVGSRPVPPPTGDQGTSEQTVKLRAAAEPGVPSPSPRPSPTPRSGVPTVRSGENGGGGKSQTPR